MKTPTSFNLLRIFGSVLLVLVIALGQAGVAQAADAHDNTQLATHRIVAGDTLYELARYYLDDPTQWPQFLQYNRIKNPLRLRPGSELHIPPVTLPDIRVIFTHGDITLTTMADPTVKTLEVGDLLQEGATISVGSGSYLSLQFDDGSIVRASSDSILRVQRYRDHARVANQTRASRTLAVEQGRLDISVTPVAATDKRKKDRANRFEVITPTAAVAVRGTRFDLSSSDTQTTSGVTEGAVAIRQGTSTIGKQQILDKGEGIRVADGKLGPVRKLLPAPDLSALPAHFDRADYMVLEWPGNADAASWQLRVAQDSAMQQVLLDTSTDSAQAKLTNLADGNYFFGVRAVDDQSIMGYETVRPFQLEATPAFPLYLAPENQQLTGSNVTLQCTPVLGASAYRIQIASGADFSSPVLDTGELDTCSYTATSLPDGHYFWRVAAIATDDQPKQGPFSAPAQFTVKHSQGAQDISQFASAFWVDDRMLDYSAQISSSADFSENVTEQALTATRVPLTQLTEGTYYIRLQATDSAGFTTAFSTPRTVEIVSQPATGEVNRTWADHP